MGRGLTIGVLSCERHSKVFEGCRIIGEGVCFSGYLYLVRVHYIYSVVSVEIIFGWHKRIFEECFDRYCLGL